jgi:hypothetical protein
MFRCIVCNKVSLCCVTLCSPTIFGAPSIATVFFEWFLLVIIVIKKIRKKCCNSRRPKNSNNRRGRVQNKELCSPPNINQCFGVTCWLHLQGQRIRQARHQHEAVTDLIYLFYLEKQKNNLCGLSPLANYTYRATAAFRIEGCHMISVMVPYGRILNFVDRIYFINIVKIISLLKVWEFSEICCRVSL